MVSLSAAIQQNLSMTLPIRAENNIVHPEGTVMYIKSISIADPLEFYVLLSLSLSLDSAMAADS